MLRFLRIKHLAVIDSVEVEFDPGLNVLTGETGAGKSILVEAVGLLLGGRASGDPVRTGEAAAAIEAIFESDGEELAGPARDHRPGTQPRVHQRHTSRQPARSRTLSNRLIELHGQHEHQTLLDPNPSQRHRCVRPTRPLADTNGRCLRRCAPRRRTRIAWIGCSRRESRLDLVTFQLNEPRARRAESPVGGGCRRGC